MDHESIICTACSQSEAVFMTAFEVGFIVIQEGCYVVILGADDRVAKSDGGDVGGTWLQLVCCALPKCLCP